MIKFSFDETIDFKLTDEELARTSSKYPFLKEPLDLKFFTILSRYLDPSLVLSESKENRIDYFEIKPIDDPTDRKVFLTFRYDADKDSIIMSPYIPILDKTANYISEQQGINVMPIVNEIYTFMFFHELGHKRHREKIKKLNELENMGKTDNVLYNETEAEANNFAKEKFLEWKKGKGT